MLYFINSIFHFLFSFAAVCVTDCTSSGSVTVGFLTCVLTYCRPHVGNKCTVFEFIHLHRLGWNEPTNANKLMLSYMYEKMLNECHTTQYVLSAAANGLGFNTLDCCALSYWKGLGMLHAWLLSLSHKAFNEVTGLNLGDLHGDLSFYHEAHETKFYTTWVFILYRYMHCMCWDHSERQRNIQYRVSEWKALTSRGTRDYCKFWLQLTVHIYRYTVR